MSLLVKFAIDKKIINQCLINLILSSAKTLNSWLLSICSLNYAACSILKMKTSHLNKMQAINTKLRLSLRWGTMSRFLLSNSVKSHSKHFRFIKLLKNSPNHRKHQTQVLDKSFKQQKKQIRKSKTFIL